MDEDEFEEDTDFDIRRGSALVKMAKAKKGKSKTVDQTEFDPPVGEAAETPEIIDETPD